MVRIEQIKVGVEKLMRKLRIQRLRAVVAVFEEPRCEPGDRAELFVGIGCASFCRSRRRRGGKQEHDKEKRDKQREAYQLFSDFHKKVPRRNYRLHIMNIR